MKHQKHTTHFGYKVLASIFTVVVLAQVFSAWSYEEPFFIPDPEPNQEDTLKFPIYDNEQVGDDRKTNSIDLEPPANYSNEVEYDPEEDSYYLREKVGGFDRRNPTSMSAEEYYKYRAQQEENSYWKQRLDALSMFNQKPELPALSKEGIFDRLFGGQAISITPQGNLDLTFGGSWQNMDNPNLIESAKKYGIFDFDMNMNINLVAQIGDKLKLNISNNTMPTFGQENTQKLEYTGQEDQIIRKIEAGNVSFPLNSSLLTGPLSLFGLKTELQFGKLFVTGVISNQKSQRKTINIQGGAQTQEFEIKADDYEENRNFLLGQHFYENYEKALENFPLINSQIVLTQVEVWVTNRTGATEGVRDAMAFMDLGENNPHVPTLVNPGTNGLPDNRVNRLYDMLMQAPGIRSQSTSTQGALGLGLKDGEDFQRSTMRKLRESEFTFQPQLGFISLNTQVNPDDILGVAYRYTYNGEVYQVGEFAEDLPPDSSDPKVVFLKMLKGGTSGRPNLPIWKLMMKNIYTIGYGGGFSAEDFRLNVIYQDPSGGEKRYLPEGPNAGIPLITLLNLDRLNRQNDPTPDGVFDFVEGITVNSQYGKIIFPKLEPFGSGLQPALGGNRQLENRYLFQMLYDSTKSIARQFQQNNRFVIKGSYKGISGGNEIRLGGFNIPEGSVSVTAGGQRLQENVDYQVNYGSGTVNILNQGILSSGMPISISFEDNANFGFVQQNFWGARFDYYANQHLTIGSTIMRLTERPYTEKVLFGDDPIKNTVIGLDINYQNEFPALTRALDKLPFYSTTAPSLISLSGEVAGIFPGHQKFINAIDPEGSVFIDDFEGANSSIDLRFPATSWHLSSVPVDARNEFGQELFPEARMMGLESGKNRAALAWYMLEPELVEGSRAPDNIRADTSKQSYWRLVQQQDLFPQRSIPSIQNFMPTFDLGYFPEERGPYNFDAVNIDASGNLLRPDSRWGGIQRAIENNSSDFEAANVEYISFWVMDPFIYNDNSNGGSLYINLGSVSEDVLKDGRLSFENGIPYPKDLAKLDMTDWGYVPRFQQQITRAFDNDEAARRVQDVGYDGLDDEEERTKFSNFLSSIQGILNAEAYQKLLDDPASDNFQHFRGNEYDQQELSALERYKKFNNPQGNSPTADLNAQFTASGTSTPETEDINRDNTLNETEAYFQYRISFLPNMNVGENNIADKKTINVKMQNGEFQDETWYQFKIPIKGYDHVVGGIGDFRSIGFMRMFLSGFEEETVLRFAQLQLDRNNWRRYLFSLTAPGENIPEEDQLNTSFAISSVSLEENYNKEPVPYRMPPGIQRQSITGGITGQNLEQDEQSMSLNVCGLKDGDARAAFKDQRLDMRQYKFLRMFIHAESVPQETPIQDGDLEAFIRVGSDFINNYYEYRIPLKVTNPGATISEDIWPEANRMNLELTQLIDAKMERNAQNHPSFLPYESVDLYGNKIIVVGNPNLGDVKNVMLGVLNPKKDTSNPNDDGLDKCAEIWFDELRMAGMEEKPGYASSGQVNLQLADLGNVHLGASMHTIGYGAIDQKVDQRFKDNFYTYDVSSNLNLGKLLPNSWGIQLPVYAAYAEMVSNPKYNPYDKDILLSDELRMAMNERDRDSIRRVAQDFNSITSFNFSNIRYLGNPEKQAGRTMPWSLKNFDASYAYNRVFKRNPDLEHDEMVDQRLSLGYSYNLRTKPIEPFKKLIKSRSKWWDIIKDINFTPLPSNFTFRNDLHRLFGETQVRNIDGGPYQMPATFYKNFTWDRTYNLRWELTKSLSFNYSALNQSRIDEPEGRIDNTAKRDSVWTNLSDFGRNTFYSQDFRVNYTLPLRKIPILNWTNITASYGTNYTWTGASLIAEDLGNVIANTQNRQINADFNFTQLYSKSRWLRAVNTPKPRQVKDNSRMNMQVAGNLMNEARDVSSDGDNQGGSVKQGGSENQGNNLSSVAENEPPKAPPKPSIPPKPERKEITRQDVKGRDTMERSEINKEFRKLKRAERKRHRKEVRAWRARKNRILPEISDGFRAAGKIATMLKRVNINYSDNSGTVLPGFMDQSGFMGVNTRSGNNWYDFAFGYQPEREWLEHQAYLNRITRDSIFNGQLQQNYAQNYNITATLEPIQDFRVDMNWKLQFSKNHTETFKYEQSSSSFQHFSPYSMGTYSISYIGIKTMFTPAKSNAPSDLYQDFLNYRTVISNRLGTNNPYTNGLQDPNNPEYAKGYTEYAQDVLIPAFLAAYGGRDVNNISLVDNDHKNIRSNPFKGFLPMPNWRLTYNGLSKLPAVSEKFSNVSITHSYIGDLSMNSFISSFYYQDLYGVGFPSFIDSNSNNFVPFFQVPNITISENLGPLIGIDLAFKSGMSLSLKFNKSRMLSLSLVDYQVSETNSTEIVLGGGHRINGLNLPFSIFGVQRLKNDLNIRMELGYRNDLTANSYLAQDIVTPTRGQKVITISPSVDYIINDQLQIRFFFDRRASSPALQPPFPITTTRAGLTLTFLFVPE